MNTRGTKFKFKIAVIGDGMVGKTSLIKKYTKSLFRKDYIKTIGAQFSVYEKEIDGDKIKLLFWDIAGQVDFNFIRSSFFNKSRAAIIVYSLEDNELGEQSFNHIIDWYSDITENCGEIPVIIFANKVDLVNENSSDDTKIQELVDKYNFLGFYKTSAKTGVGVIEAFNALIENLYHKFKVLSTEL
ncbi:MAG: Rab family GTPase [Promethearchaeota archaeon]